MANVSVALVQHGKQTCHQQRYAAACMDMREAPSTQPCSWNQMQIKNVQ